MQNMSAEGLANIAKEAAASGQDPQEAVADFVQQTLEAAQAVEPTISSNLGNLQLKSTKGKKNEEIQKQSCWKCKYTSVGRITSSRKIESY